MAIPDNYIDKITKDGESRMISPAADNVRVNNEHYEGDNLDEVLDEIASAIDEAGSGDGTVKGVKVGSTTYDPDSETGVVDLSTPIADKVDKVPGKGLSTNDYTDADQAKLQALPTADGLTQQLNSKANANEVYKKTETYSQSEVDDALADKADADDVPTNQDMADAIDDALGEAQVTVVPAGSVGVISSLGSDSDTDALSASMGKKLKVAVITILNSLGNYAFPNGKPVIDWGGSSSVTYTVTYPTDSRVTHTGAGDTVELGSSLEVTLGIASGNDIYVIKDSSVKVYMSGVEQSGAYNASTQKVTLAAVTGNVVIIAEAWTYVDRGLVLHLDGRNRGGTAGKWKSLVDYNSNPLYFKLENCDEQSDYVAGNGTNSKGTAFSNPELTTPVTLLDVGAADGTIEAAYSHAEINSNGNLGIMHNGLGSGNRICLMSWHSASPSIPVTNPDAKNLIVMCSPPGDNNVIGSYMLKTDIASGGVFSCSATKIQLNGNSSTEESYGSYQATDANSMLSLFWRKTTNENFFKLRLYELRVYSVQLTDAERAQNLAIDQKRFNLS